MDYPAKYASQLETLKKKLDDQALSVLVGAGFSKNFDANIFPNWWELIFDMVRDGLETEMEDRYKQLFPKKKSSGPEYELFLKKRIEKYIDNVGPLEAVSEFIRRKGYRESVDVRIEEKTPYIEVKNGTRHINYSQGGKRVSRPVTSDELKIHQKLVSLPWNNIYTTNYDNLLEESVDITIALDFEIAINDLSEEIARDLTGLKEKQKRYADLQEEFDTLKEQSSENQSGQIDLPADTGTTRADQRVKELIPAIATLKREVSAIELGIKDKDERLAELKRKQHQINSLVTYSSQLALKKNGNIIKLHGSVRTKTTDGYGFDNDARTHYIISKEDFDNYPNKHEAFMQLMRIALLQESFCLLGFSGIDPNFLSWIGWVRDVVERKKAEIDNTEDKIYLIDVGMEAADTEKALFHLNHRIAFIPLGHPECRLFLEEKTGRNLPAEPSRRQLIELFLDYLSIDSLPSKIKIGFEVFQQERYLQLWQKSSWRGSLDVNTDPLFLLKKVNDFSRLQRYNRIPSNTYEFIIRYELLQALESRLKALLDIRADLSDLIKLSADVLSEHLLLLRDTFGESDIFDRLVTLARKSNSDDYYRLLIVELRDAVWTNAVKRVNEIKRILAKADNPLVKQEFFYQEILHELFNLRFKSAYQLISNWNPLEHWIVRKAGLLFLFDPSAALSLLKQEKMLTVQESVYQLQLMAYTSLAVMDFSGRTRSVKLVEAITQEGLKDVNHSIDQILEKLNRRKQKIEPYGYDKFVTSRTITFGGGNDWALAQIFFRLLSETGFPVSVPSIPFKQSSEVHSALFLAYPNLPYPVIFYLFQYTDEKLIIKIAQDYSTNTELADQLITIFNNITLLFSDQLAPHYIRQNGLVFLSELVNVIEPTIWEPFFVEVWEKLSDEGSLFIERHRDKNFFIEKALKLVQRPTTVIRVINDTLYAIISPSESKVRATAIRYLYELNFNEQIKLKAALIRKGLDKVVLKTLTDGIVHDIELLFVFGNINFALTRKERSLITSKIREIESLSSNNERIWRIILHFAEGDDVIIARIKDAVLHNKRLWDAGFTTNGRSGYNNHISLYQLGKAAGISQLTWTSPELSVIYDKLKEVLTRIESWSSNHEEFSTFKSILDEMIWFLDNEKRSLSYEDDYPLVLKRIRTLLNREKGYIQTKEGLMSTEKETFTSALDEVFFQLYKNESYETLDFAINLILNRILLQTAPGLAEALGMTADWFLTKKKNSGIQKYGPLLLEILQRYQSQLPENIDLPFIENKLVTIANVLKSWKYDDSSIEMQLRQLNESRFMETRYNLGLMLKD